MNKTIRLRTVIDFFSEDVEGGGGGRGEGDVISKGSLWLGKKCLNLALTSGLQDIQGVCEVRRPEFEKKKKKENQVELI